MNRAAHAQGRKLRPLPELVEMVSDTDISIEALCYLLRQAGPQMISADRIYTLLAPIHARLSSAADDLTDLRL